MREVLLLESNLRFPFLDAFGFLPGAARGFRVGLRVDSLALVHYVEVGQFGEVRVAAVADEAGRLARLQQPHIVDLLLHLRAAVLEKEGYELRY